MAVPHGRRPCDLQRRRARPHAEAAEEAVVSRITFREPVRGNIPLLLGFAGGTGSGKTMSMLKVARGIAGGQPFAFIDTENGRALHYADLFPEMRHAEINAPFRPETYQEAIHEGCAQFGVVVVDSFSHEWAGDGGCLDWADEIGGGDAKKNASKWIPVKRSHKRLMTSLLQERSHILLGFRAEPKVDIVRKDGRVEIVPKQTVTGLDGWVPITEKMVPYELTASFLLMAEKPGFPRPIKLQEQHRPFVPLDRPLSEETGAALAAWAAGAGTDPKGTPAGVPVEGHNGAAGAPAPATAEEKLAVLQLAESLQVSEDSVKAIVRQVTGSPSLRGSVESSKLAEIAAMIRLEAGS